MRHVLILGAGKSASVLIEYMLSEAEAEDWIVTVGDVSPETALQKIGGHARGKAIAFDAEDASSKEKCIAEADIVISLLPPSMHVSVAEICVRLGKSFVCASYVDAAMRTLHDDAVRNHVLLLNECGLDPGIDHMSAMHMLHAVKAAGGEILSFESYTGGLIAPESDTNPWHYKFTWNPRNVVLAGQGTAKFLLHGTFKYVPYQALFTRYDILEVPGYGTFEGYPNRDSLGYREIYGLEEVRTLVRGTLRKRGFCDAWNVFVQLGMTDDGYVLEGMQGKTWIDFTNSFLPEQTSDTENTFAAYTHIDPRGEIMEKMRWLGLFEYRSLPSGKHSPAQYLQILLEEKWKLEPDDKDMCVMLHVMEYSLSGKKYRRQSSMVVCGTDNVHTAMAKTVGLPAGIAAKNILNGVIRATGVHIPVDADMYIPILQELAAHGIQFTEEVSEIE